MFSKIMLMFSATIIWGFICRFNYVILIIYSTDKQLYEIWVNPKTFHFFLPVWASKPFHRQTNNNGLKCSLDNTKVTCLIEPPKSPQQSETTFSNDVFLGGSLSTGNNWRNEIAIPLLKKHGLTYYNPAVREANENFESKIQYDNGIDIVETKKIMDRSRVLMMVITNDTRSMRTIILSAYYIALNKDIVLCVQSLPTEGCLVQNETVSFYLKIFIIYSMYYEQI